MCTQEEGEVPQRIEHVGDTFEPATFEPANPQSLDSLDSRAVPSRPFPNGTSPRHARQGCVLRTYHVHVMQNAKCKREKDSMMAPHGWIRRVRFGQVGSGQVRSGIDSRKIFSCLYRDNRGAYRPCTAS